MKSKALPWIIAVTSLAMLAIPIQESVMVA
jgi:hypothetical protein